MGWANICRGSQSHDEVPTSTTCLCFIVQSQYNRFTTVFTIAYCKRIVICISYAALDIIHVCKILFNFKLYLVLQILLTFSLYACKSFVYGIKDSSQVSKKTSF
jgi:hypothetical protein